MAFSIMSIIEDWDSAEIPHIKETAIMRRTWVLNTSLLVAIAAVAITIVTQLL